EVGHYGPAFLPDGRRFLYARPIAAPSSQFEVVLYAGSLDTKSKTRLRSVGTYDSNSNRTGTPGVYVPPGYYLESSSGSLIAERVRAEGTFTGDGPFRFAYNGAAFSASDNLLLSRQGASGGVAQQNSLDGFNWFDRSGKQEGSVGDPAFYGGAAISPDGRRAV